MSYWHITVVAMATCYHSNEVCSWCLLSQISTMPNMKLIWLKTKELQSYKVDFSWQSIMGPLVIVSTSYHREYLLSSEASLIIGSTSSYRECKASWDLLSSEAPLIIESTSYHRKHLLSSEAPLLIESAKHHGTSCHRKHLLSSRVPLIIGSTSYHRKHLFLSRVQSIMGPLVIGSTSYHREYLLSSERLLSSETPLLTAPLVIERHFCQTGSVIDLSWLGLLVWTLKHKQRTDHICQFCRPHLTGLGVRNWQLWVMAFVCSFTTPANGYVPDQIGTLSQVGTSSYMAFVM